MSLLLSQIVGLQVPVLVKHPNTGELVKNFDPYIFEVIKESEYMIKNDLDIPESAKVLVHSRDKLRSHQEQMQVRLCFIYLHSLLHTEL